MTYPGTAKRERTALESSLAADVLRLERERDELVEAFHLMTHYMQLTFMDDVENYTVYATPTSAISVVRRLLAKYPPRSSAEDRE